MRNILLNNNEIVTINSPEDAFDIIRDELSDDLAQYLVCYIRQQAENLQLTYENFVGTAEMCKAYRKHNDELTIENQKLTYELRKVNDKLCRIKNEVNTND